MQKAYKIFKTWALIALMAAFMTQYAVGARTNASPVNSDIFSTNTVITYSNLGGGNFSTNGESTNLLVQAIFGFTNTTGVTYSALTNPVSAGSTYDFTNIFVNYGNTNTTYNFAYGTNSTGTVGGTWTVELLDLGGLTRPTTNIIQDGTYTNIVRVGVSASAENNAIYQVHLTNYISDTPWADFYLASNGFTYGGYSNWSDIISMRVGGPIVTATKDVSITNDAGGDVGAQAVVPGAIVTYTIDYTNSGSAGATNVWFTEQIDTNFVGYLNGSGSAGIEFSTDGGGTWAAAPGSAVDYTLNAIRLPVAWLPSATGGSVSYKVVVR